MDLLVHDHRSDGGILAQRLAELLAQRVPNPADERSRITGGKGAALPAEAETVDHHSGGISSQPFGGPRHDHGLTGAEAAGDDEQAGGLGIVPPLLDALFDERAGDPVVLRRHDAPGRHPTTVPTSSATT